LPLNEPIDDVPDCRASLLRRASIGEVPAFLAGAELSAVDLQQTTTSVAVNQTQDIF